MLPNVVSRSRLTATYMVSAVFKATFVIGNDEDFPKNTRELSDQSPGQSCKMCPAVTVKPLVSVRLFKFTNGKTCSILISWEQICIVGI